MKALRAAFFVVGLIATGLLLAGSMGRKPAPQDSFSIASQADLDGPSSATVYRADLKPVGGSGVTGEVEIGVKGDNLGVSVNANGLKASVEHAQHIHENADCSPPGAPIIALDDDVSNNPRDATNADPEDDSFPTATPGGTINYREQDSASGLENALEENLDLANRTVVVHAPGDPIGPAAACGELNPVED